MAKERDSMLLNSFQRRLTKHQITLQRSQVRILQVNIGKRCNQACSHCHVESSPFRKENMEQNK